MGLPVSRAGFIGRFLEEEVEQKKGDGDLRC
jgi:hypothetical protein